MNTIIFPTRQMVLLQSCNSLICRLETYSKRSSQPILKNVLSEGFPAKLLHKKHKTPPSLYVATEELSKSIVKLVKPFLNQLSQRCNTAVEITPGIGLLTRELLKSERFRKLLLFEPEEHFHADLRALHAAQPERVAMLTADFVNIWKLAYQDKIDHGHRVPDLLQDIPKHPHTGDPNCVLFGAVGCYAFFKHLINSVIFQHSFLTAGRCEMFLVVPPPIYIHLTCSRDIGYMIYRSTSMLFQILFEHRFIAQLPRDQFLPPQIEYLAVKGSKLGRVKSINPEYLYLVKIVPRRELFDLCAVEDLPALWYFVKQNCISRRYRVIPNLEKWVPGCGPRLIINSQPPIPTVPIYADEDLEHLPQYSHRCTTMSNRDWFPNMNIYTQFGDLSASQILSLFTQFRQWPEYGDSSFLASLENSLLKMEASADEVSIDGIGIAEEDDVGNEALESERQTTNRSAKFLANASI